MDIQASRRWMLRVVALFAIALAFGVRAEDQNPIYKSWASHKPGTTVKMKRDSEVNGTKASTEVTQTLKEVTPEKVVVEIKNTSDVDGHKVDTTAIPTDIPAKGPSLKTNAKAVATPDVKKSEETVKVGDKSYKCKVLEVVTKTGGLTASSKTWTCDEVPGTLVKSEIKTEGQFATTSKSELTEVTLK